MKKTVANKGKAMKRYIKHIITFLTLSIGLSIATQPMVNAHAHDNLETTTALLRGPVAYLEYELRNDTSRSAHAKKALIAAIRLINDLHSQTATLKHHSFGWFVYDAHQIFEHLKALLTTQKKPTELAQNATEQKLSDNKDYQFLRRFVLPMIEMLGALGRTELVKSELPHRGGNFGSIVITMSRLGQLYCAAPRNSTNRKIILALFVWCFVDILNEIKRLRDEIQRLQAIAELRRQLRLAGRPGPWPEPDEWHDPAVQEAFRRALEERARIAGEEEAGRRQQPEVHFVDRNENLKLFFTGENPKECPLCTEEKSSNDLCALPGCGHVHCKICIMNWLKKSNTCPECKQPCNHLLFNISEEELAHAGKDEDKN